MIWLALLGPLASATVVDRVAAVVNDEVIALSEVHDLGGDFIAQRCPGEGDPQCVVPAELEVLDALLRRAMIRQELDRLDLQVTAADVDQAIDRTVRQYQLEDRQQLREEVEASGKRWDQYREELFEFLRTQTFQARVLAPRVSVSEDEVRDFYQRASRKVKKETAKVSGLGIPVPPDATPDQVVEITLQASNLVQEINAGELTWEQAVADYDTAGVSRMLAGQAFDQGMLIEEVDEVVFAAEVGVVQPPRRVGDVLFVIRVEERGERSEVAPFEEVRGQLEEQVFQEKLQDAEEEWYQRARREAALVIKLQVP